MRPALLALIIVGVVVILIPQENQILRALGRSAPRPELESLLLKRLETSPQKVPLLRQIARIRRDRADVAGELAIRERWHALAPDCENLEEMLHLYLWNNRSEEAYRAARELLAATPESRELRERVLELAEYSGRIAEARDDARWLLERGCRDPRLARAFLAARDVEGLTALLSNPRDRARALVAVEAQPLAIEAYVEHLEREPGDWGSHRALAQLYRWNAKILEAAAELEACLAIKNDQAVRAEVVELYKAAGRIDLMLRHLPENLERAEVLLALGRVDEAKVLYEKFERLDKLLDLAAGMPSDDEEIAVRERLPMFPDNRKRLAALYVWRKEFAKALAQYEALGDERAVDMHLAMGDVPAAIRTAQALGLHRRLGSLYLWLGDLDNAIAELEQVPEEAVELARLYIRVGRRGDGVRLLETLDIDSYLRLELYAYAGEADKAVRVGRSIPAADWEPERIEHVAASADAGTAIGLYKLLLERSPGEDKYALALAELYEHLGRREEAAAYMREVLARHPDDPQLLARLGLLTSDREILERAVARGSRDARIYRRLAEIARLDRRPEDAIRWYREYHRLKDDDAETHFALGELTGDRREFDRAWELLPPGEHRIRARILWRRGDLAGAEKLFREAEDILGLVDLLLEMKRYDEAAKLPMTPRQQAVLALGQGRYADAVKILRGLDLTDPDVRSALAQSLYAMGHWQEAEDYATGELKKEIHGTYGPEASASAALTESSQQHLGNIAARYRMYLAEPLYVRLEALDRFARGQVPGIGDVGENIEEADLGLYYRFTPRFHVGAGAGDWRNSRSDTVEAFAEMELREPEWGFGIRGRFDEPWADSVGAVALGGIENRIEAGLNLTPAPWLVFYGGVEERWYRIPEDPLLGIGADTAQETRGRARVELRLWTGEGTVGRYFYDAPLARDAGLQSHFGFALEYDYADLRGSQSLINTVGLSPRVEMVTVGPTAAWAGDGWGVFANAFIGEDQAREIPFGKLWGGTGGIVVTCFDRWKLGATVEYVSEQRLSTGGPSWTANIGLNYNF